MDWPALTAIFIWQIKIDGIQKLRAAIGFQIDQFENNLFVRVKEFVRIRLEPYQEQLEQELQNFYALGFDYFTGDLIDESYKYFNNLQNQLGIIDNILATENLDEFVALLPSYIYLRNQTQ